MADPFSSIRIEKSEDGSRRLLTGKVSRLFDESVATFLRKNLDATVIVAQFRPYPWTSEQPDANGMTPWTYRCGQIRYSSSSSTQPQRPRHKNFSDSPGRIDIMVDLTLARFLRMMQVSRADRMDDSGQGTRGARAEIMDRLAYMRHGNWAGVSGGPGVVSCSGTRRSPCFRIGET